MVAKRAKAGAAVENVAAFGEFDFHAGGIPPISHIFAMRCRSGPAHAPELDSHKLLSECS
jgi:hypothetical protein